MRLLLAVLVASFTLPCAAQPAAAGPLIEAAGRLFTQGLYDEAYRTFVRVVEMDSAAVDAHVGAAWAAVLLGHPLAARTHAGAVARLAASGPEGYNPGRGLGAAVLARMALDQGDVPEAFAQFVASRAEARGSLYPRDSTAAWQMRQAVGTVVIPKLDADLRDALFRYTADNPREDMVLFLVRDSPPSKDGEWLTELEQNDQRVHQHLTRLLSVSGAEYVAHFGLGLYERFRSLGEARSHFRQAVSLRPSSYGALVELGDVEGRYGDVAAALETFRQASQMYPDSFWVRIGRYRSLAMAGSEREALVVRRGLLEQTEHVNPEMILGSLQPFCAFHLQREIEAPSELPPSSAQLEECFAPYLWNDPLRGQTWAELGAGYAYRGDHREAVRAYERAIRYAPDSLDYRVGLAQVRYDAGEQAAALSVLADHVARHPGHMRGRMAYGRVLLADRPRDAVVQYGAVARVDPNNANAQYFLGVASAMSGDMASAVRPLEIAATLEPQATPPLRVLAIAYAQSGQREEALRALSRLRALNAEEAQEVEANVLNTLAALAPVSPLGEGWTYAIESSSTVFWAQTSRLRRSGSIVDVWVAGVAAERKTREFQALLSLPAQQARRVNRTMTRYEIDCSGVRAKLHAGVFYDSEGGLVEQSEDLYPSWSSAVPGSVLDGIVEHVCAQR